MNHDPEDETTGETGQAAEAQPWDFDPIRDPKAKTLARDYQIDRPIPSEISSHLAWKIIGAKPSRMHAWHRLLDELSQSTKWSIDTIVWSILHTACWVVDLPASEKRHHRAPFGLFDHALEVALGALLTHQREFEWWLRKTDRSASTYTARLVAYLVALHHLPQPFHPPLNAPLPRLPSAPHHHPL